MPETTDETLLTMCRRLYGEALGRGERLLEGLSEEETRTRRHPKSWSIVECLDHVSRTNGLYVERLGPVLRAAREQGREGEADTGRGTLLGRFILSNLRQGPKAKRVPAPRAFRPADAPSLAEVHASFRQGLKRLDELAGEAEGLPLHRLRFVTPAMPLARVNAAEAFEMMALHTHRHLAQAERVRGAGPGG